MPALAVTRSRTQWTATFANPPINRVDPEPELGAIGRLPRLAGRARALEVILASTATAKGLIDRATLPTEDELATAYAAFFASASRLMVA